MKAFSERLLAQCGEEFVVALRESAEEHELAALGTALQKP